ncbi:MAG: hypothetical protein GY822_17845 [Deltaproteobacteria bacterium]|nr:hypothetical protein [Deltaproteobacteria bacterium]
MASLGLPKDSDGSKPWRDPLVDCLQNRNSNFSFSQVQLTADATARAEQVLPKSPLVDCGLVGNAATMQCQVLASAQAIPDVTDEPKDADVDTHTN